jgi:competence protein ComEC
MALAKRTVGERLGAPLAILALLVYTVFVGASASVVRATIMGILIILAQRLGRDTFALNSLAALVMTALNPLTLWGGAAALAALVWQPAGQALAAVSWVFITWTVRVVEAGAAVPGASAGFPPNCGGLRDYVPSAWVWAYYVLLFGLTALPERRRAWLKAHLRATSVLLTLVVAAVLLWTAVPLLPDGRLHVTVLNVEDGSEVLIQTPDGRRILVDGGPRASTLLSQVGRRLPWWDLRIDVVILTNPKPTRLTGLLGVLERYDVG